MKYAPLQEYLASFKGSSWHASFAEIERVLGFALPQSAHLYPAWWENEETGNHSQCRAWREAGWKTEDVDLGGQRVTFCRDQA